MSSENTTSCFCNHFSIIQSHHAWKMCSGRRWESSQVDSCESNVTLDLLGTGWSKLTAIGFFFFIFQDVHLLKLFFSFAAFRCLKPLLLLGTSQDTWKILSHIETHRYGTLLTIITRKDMRPCVLVSLGSELAPKIILEILSLNVP